MTGPYLLPDNERTYNTRLSLRNTIKTPAMRTSTFDATFFFYCTKELNQLNDDTTKIESIIIKKKHKRLLKLKKTLFLEFLIFMV